MIELTLNDKHEYRDKDGKIWPSVTQIIQDAGLANQHNHDNYAATRGSYAHKACHLYDQGTLVWDTLDDTIRPYVESYIKLRELRPEEVVLSEKLIYSETFRFSGTVDKIMQSGLSNDLWDLKTGAFDPSHELQTAAYALAWQEMTGNRIVCRYGIHLQSNGSIAKIVKHDKLNSKQIFLAAHAVVQWIKNNRS